MIHASSADRFLVTARIWGAGWWLVFLGIAALAIGGLSTRTIVVACIGVASYLAGTVPMFGATRAARARPGSGVCRQPTWTMLFVVLVVLFQFGMALQSIGSLFNLGARYRESYYEGDVYGGSILFVLYESFIVPLGVFAVAHWLCSRHKIGLWRFAAASFFCLDALLKAGRFPLYFLFFFFAVSRLIGVTRIRVWVYVVVGCGLAFGALLLSLAREGLDIDSGWEVISNLLRIGVLNYHVVGFYIFQKISNSATFVGTLGAGSYTFGFASYFLALVGRRAGFDVTYAQQGLNIALTNEIYIPTLGTYNAFGTNMLPLYLDAGILGVAAGFYVLGWLVRGGLRRGSQVEAIDVVALFTMVFGIFQPLIMSAYFLLPLSIACIRKLTHTQSPNAHF